MLGFKELSLSSCKTVIFLFQHLVDPIVYQKQIHIKRLFIFLVFYKLFTFNPEIFLGIHFGILEPLRVSTVI